MNLFSLLICSLLSTISVAEHHDHQYGTVRIGMAQLSVNELESVGKARELGTMNIPLEQKLSKLVRLSTNYTIQLAFTILDSSSEEPIDGIQQAFLQFTHSKTPDHQVYFIGKQNKKQKGTYAVEIKMSRDVSRFKGRPGKYHCELIVGDRRVRDGFRWEMFDAFLDIPKHHKEAQSYEPRKRDLPNYEMKSEIVHTFKEVETCNPQMWPLFYAFSGFCLLPLLLLILHWYSLMPVAFQKLFPPTNATYSGPMFYNLLIVLFALYTVCWLLGTSMAFLLKIAGIVAIPTFLAGYKMLRNIAKKRMEMEATEYRTILQRQCAEEEDETDEENWHNFGNNTVIRHEETYGIENMDQEIIVESD